MKNNTTTVKKRRVIALSLALLLALSLTAVPAAAAERPWEGPYANFVRQEIQDGGDYVTLADFDNDGVPEVLVGWLAAHGNRPLKAAATYKKGAIHTLRCDDMEVFDINVDFALYTKKATGERKIEVQTFWHSGTYYGAGVSSLWVEGYTLRNVSVYDSSIDLSGQSAPEYYVYGQAVSESKYNSACASWEKGWTKVSDFQVVYGEVGRDSSVADIKDLFSKWKGGESAQTSGNTASPSKHSMTVDGKKVSPAAYNINGNNYFKLRDIAALLNGTNAQFQVGYDQQTKAVSLTTGQPYTFVGGELATLPEGAQTLVPTPSAVYVDGRQVSFTAYNINGNNYFKLRDLGQALGFSVGWNESTRTVVVETQ